MVVPADSTTTEAITELRGTLKGQVIDPNDPGYDESRSVFYAGFDRRPAAIARVADEADVARVITVARQSGLPLAVRSGGHSTAGHSVCDGGIVLDLRSMKGLDIDIEQRTAWAQTGLTTGEYTAAAGVHGLATGFGDTGSVGLGGITLGGGIGYLVRRYGLTIDDVLAAEIVTADGELRRVDDDSHPDLFWAIRGGGGNFGVATRFQLRLHELGTVVGGMLVLPATPDAILSFMAEAEAAPEELSAIANIMVAPPMPFVPPEAHGQLVMMAMMVHAGSVEAGEQAIAPFRALATPIADTLGPMPYPQMFEAGDDDFRPIEESARSMFIDAVDLTAAEAIVEHLRASTAQLAVAQLRVMGGAMARVPPDATAFAHRGRRVLAAVGSVYEKREEIPAQEAWAIDFAAALRSGEPGVYVNFLTDEDEERVNEAYPKATWDRLAAIKQRYDPTNLFRLNHNIPPS